MAAQKGSSVFAKLGERGRAAHSAAAQNPVTVGNAGLPAGIENGIAQLVDIHFGEYKDGPNKGKPFFMASAIVVQPTEIDGVPIAGLRTQIGPEPLCDTPQATGKRKTFQDHYDWMINQIGLVLGVQPGQTVEIGFDDVESTCANLVAEAPYIRFRTWKGQKQTTGPFANREPRVQHEWNGRIEYSPTNDPGAGVTDAAPTDQPPFDEFNQEPAPAADEPTADELQTMHHIPQGDDAPDWSAVGEVADRNVEGDAEMLAAQDQLITRCQELGINHEETTPEGGYVYGTWGEIAAAISEVEAAPQEPEPSPEPPPPPPPPPQRRPAPPAKPAQAAAKPAPKPAAKPALKAATAKKPAPAPAKKPAGRR